MELRFLLHFCVHNTYSSSYIYTSTGNCTDNPGNFALCSKTPRKRSVTEAQHMLFDGHLASKFKN